MPLDAAEVAKHNTLSSCWIVISGKVYDVTPYLEHHPGGAAILARQGGRDATSEFRTVHPPEVVEYLPKGSFLGETDAKALATLTMASTKKPTPAPAPEPATPPDSVPLLIPPEEPRTKEPLHIAHVVTLPDFETAAKSVFSRNTYSYISSSANTGFSLANNLASWSRITFRPRILRPVQSATPHSSILTHRTPLPIYISAMGHLGRGHPGGEVALVRAAARRGAHVLLSTVTTQPIEEIAAALADEQKKLAQTNSADAVSPSCLHFQLYVRPDRAVTRSHIRRAKAAGAKTLWLTVDTAVLGKRTLDRRTQALEALEAGLPDAAERAALGQRSHVNQSMFEPGLSWDDVAWVKAEFGGPVVLKGVQTFEDARMAVEVGVQGVVLSNHGGRQAHSAPEALATLLEIRRYAPEVLDKIQVFVDGGLRDGADVLKAICLGATAVGVGRPFFYALGAYGERGVERCFDILAEELVNGMQLLGIKSLDEAGPELVNASRLINEMWQPEKSRL
ncbi:FMN-dependent dehydrogenase-domain-containing protein [Annulohypoxylon maeteangense]|uniref:FMN-dependent dehydrogenase-domain-containing protein n=1 Tax=Annulohypoxylon maeteangense TaxID=1927788 RepID=UPI002008156F|nr:FMN-dependent dehydrogenase-domain-containing protein [Annulohypoxylon maeteangense]KAI0886463.1 FMN-dependent dehydrogenase-domain-containing protein [Annulohypoxylon maeteangense]